MQKIDISVIVPIYKEGDAVREFLTDLIGELEKIGRTYEILVLDNDTVGNSKDILKKIVKENPRVKAYTLTHPGVAVIDKSNKYILGFKDATGEIIIQIDGDGQDRPEEISKFIEKIEEGFDLAVGYKQNRRDSSFYKLPSYILNWIIRTLTKTDVHDMNNGFKAYRSKVAKSLNLYGGNFRYIPIILNYSGYKISEVPVKHFPRKFGEGKFTFASRLKGGVFDLISILLTAIGGQTPLYSYGMISSVFLLISLVVLADLVIFTHTIETILVRGAIFLFFLFLSFFSFSIGFILENMKTAVSKNDIQKVIIEKF